MKVWDKERVESDLKKAYSNNSEIDLLAILKENSFLFYELVFRKYGVQPIFHEVQFGKEQRCDFAWLNDNSDGPEWVLVEVEKPELKLFTKKKEPTSEFHHSMEQVKSWIRCFKENPLEKSAIFGAVAKFRIILVVGSLEEWNIEANAKWRIEESSHNLFEIRSSNVFLKALENFKNKPDEFWSFEEHPRTLKRTELQTYWENYGYFDMWRKILK